MRNLSNEALESELERFVEMSPVLDKQTRKYIAAYFRYKIEPEQFEDPELNDEYFVYLKSALDSFFKIEGLENLISDNDKLGKQVISDIIYWLNQTYRQVAEDHPFEDEVKRLAMWAEQPLEQYAIRHHHLTTYLNEKYPLEKLDVSYYEKEFSSLFREYDAHKMNAEQKERAELIIKDLMAQWDALLNTKLLEYQLKHFQESQEDFQDKLEAKVDEYFELKNIVNPVAEYTGRFWDMSRELWKETSFEALKKYDELLQDEKSVKQLADLLGKMREAEVEIEEDEYENIIVKKEWINDPTQRAEVKGVKSSDEISNMLSSETALLSNEETESVFLKRFADKQLQTLRYEVKKLVHSKKVYTETRQKKKRREKGPFIICIDTSESMEGRPEQIAKVICLAILKMASREDRRAYLINFSSGIKTIDLKNLSQSVDEIAKFLQMSFYGGTDVSLPIYEALRMLETDSYRDADVLIISDFIMYHVDEEVMQQVKHYQQNKNVQFHSITLSDTPESEIVKRFDSNWLYNPDKKGIIRQIADGLKTIRELRY